MFLPLMLLLPFTLLFFSCYPAVEAGSANNGDPCSQGDSRLQAGTYQFFSDCNSQTFCSSSGTCQPKGCRNDDFPFGYPQDSSDIPPKCERGEFCPDEEDACQPLLPVGSACQLNRDDECEAPPNFKELADDSHQGLNFNGSVCLNNQCMWANVTLGLGCVVENTAYIAYGPSGEFPYIVSRGNCRLGLYCDSQQKVCMQNKLLGDACTADKECDSLNCLSSGVCGVSAATPHNLGIWVYVVVGVGIFGGMFGTLIGLFILHRRQRDKEREKRAQYWREQNAFHQNLMQMRDTARASILSLPQNGGNSTRSTVYGREGFLDESHAPILQHAAPKASGLRHYLSEDTSSDFDEGLIMQPDRKDGRF